VSIGVREATFEDAAALRSFLTAQRLPTEDILAPGTVYWVAETETKEVIASAGLEFGGEAGLLRSVATAEIHMRRRSVSSAQHDDTSIE